MPSIRTHCTFPTCNKLAVVTSTDDLRPLGINLFVYKLQCGHSITEECIPEVESVAEDTSFNGNNGFKAFDYQIDGVKFIEHSNFNCLLADSMGLGKTPQSLIAYKRNRSELTPTIVICKSSLHINWCREYFRWVLEIDPTSSNDIKTLNAADIPFIHPFGDMPLVPGFNLYLLSMDLLGKPIVLESIKNAGIKCLIVDECHNFKAMGAKRTKALMEISAYIPHKIMLSGTPIMNKTLEYFPILNIIKPRHFPEQKYFARQFLDFDYRTSRWLGFTTYGKKRFFDLTKDYILRREVKDVQKDLPEVFTQKYYIAGFDKQLVKQYNKLADELEEAINEKSSAAHNSTSILGILSNLRHLTGLMKVSATIDHVKEFLESSDEKICIGIHHKLVRQLLMQGLSEYNPIELSGSDDGIAKDGKVELFKDPNRRVMIANILAGGEGLNLQFCNNCLICERQWNPAKENQFIKRFHRHGQKLTVFVGNMIAADTIDEFFITLLELKKNIIEGSMDINVESDPAFIRELCQMVVSKRLQYTGV